MELYDDRPLYMVRQKVFFKLGIVDGLNHFPEHTKFYQQCQEEIPAENDNGYLRFANYLIGHKLMNFKDLFQSKLIYQIIAISNPNIEMPNEYEKSFVESYLSEVVGMDYQNNDMLSNFSHFLKNSFFNYFTQVDMITKCQTIFSKFNLTLEDFDPFMEPKSFLPLLQCLNINEEIYTPNSDITSEQLKSLIIQCKVPYFLQDYTFEQRDFILTYCQIYAILERIDFTQLQQFSPKYIYYIDKNSTESGLLKTINGIVYEKKKWHFYKITDVVDEQYFPFFVNLFFNDPELQAIAEKQSNDYEHEKRTSTIEFLKNKIDKIKCSCYYFDDQFSLENSAISLCSTLIDHAFIKAPKREMIERCDRLIGSKMKVETLNDFKNLSPILYLLHFIIYKNLDIPEQSSSFSENYNTIYKYCVKLKIPFVFECDSDPENENAFIYQLQFIYNVIDNSLALKFIDEVKKFKAKIQKVHVPAFSKLADSIRAKSLFLKLQSGKSSDNFNIERQTIASVPKPTLFTERCQFEIINLDLNAENLNLNDNIEGATEIDFSQYEENPNLFWNKVSDSNFSYLNGILAGNENEENTQFKDVWNKEIKKYPKVEEEGSSSPRIKRYGFDTKLVKYAYYSEKLGQWRRKNIHTFFTNRQIAQAYSKTPLFLFVDSDESSVISIMSKFIIGQYPNLNIFPTEEEECNTEEIFVYLLSEKNLQMLLALYKQEFKSYGLDVRPIFAMVHVPDSKKDLPNLKSILMTIYAKLYSIAQFSIVVLDKEHVSDQLQFIQDIEKLSMELEEPEPDYSSTKDYNYTLKNKHKLSSNKPPKNILLLNEQSLPLHESQLQILNKSPLLTMIQSKLNNIAFSSFINIDNIESYRVFLVKMREFIQQTDMPFPTTDDVILDDKFMKEHSDNYIDAQIRLKKDPFRKSLSSKEKLQIIQSSQESLQRDFTLIKTKIVKNLTINTTVNKLNDLRFPKYQSQRYIHVYLQIESFDDILNQRISQYKRTKIGDSESLELLGNEIMEYFPNEVRFREAFTSFKYQILSKGNNIAQFVRKELKQTTDEHIQYLKYRVEQKVYWSNIEIQMFSHLHMKLLNDEFYSIIVNKHLASYADEVFGEILQAQKNIDKERINDIFQQYYAKIEQRKITTLRSMKDEMKTSMQYVLKERESIKELKVALEVGQKLETEIEQDF